MTKEMKLRETRQPGWINLAVVISSAYVMFALLLSAVFVADLRVLHPLQMPLYIAIIILTQRKMALGFGIGCFMGVFWDYLVVGRGPQQLWDLITGKAFRPDLAIQLVAVLAHVVLVAACITGFVRIKPGINDWGKFLFAGILSIVYLVVLMFFLRPQHIPLLKHQFGL